MGGFRPNVRIVLADHYGVFLAPELCGCQIVHRCQGIGVFFTEEPTPSLQHLFLELTRPGQIPFARTASKRGCSSPSGFLLELGNRSSCVLWPQANQSFLFWRCECRLCKWRIDLDIPIQRGPSSERRVRASHEQLLGAIRHRPVDFTTNDRQASKRPHRFTRLLRCATGNQAPK